MIFVFVEKAFHEELLHAITLLRAIMTPFKTESRVARLKQKAETRVVQLLHFCGPLFEIIRVCGPQPAKNTHFCPKLSLKKKKGLQLESISEIPIFVPKSGCSLKKKKKGLQLKSISEIPIFVPKS